MLIGKKRQKAERRAEAANGNPAERNCRENEKEELHRRDDDERQDAEKLVREGRRQHSGAGEYCCARHPVAAPPRLAGAINARREILLRHVERGEGRQKRPRTSVKRRQRMRRRLKRRALEVFVYGFVHL